MITQVIDNKITQQLYDWRNELTDSYDTLKESWIRCNGLTACVTTGYSVIDPDEAIFIANAMQSVGCSESFVIPLGDDFPEIIKINASAEDLHKFSFNQFIASYYLIIPENKSFAILKNPDEYAIFAGSRNFVEIAVGGDIDKAKRNFFEFAHENSNFFSEEEKTFFKKLYRIYSKYS